MLILSKERTEGIEVTMNKPDGSPYSEYAAEYKQIFNDHVKDAPRLPILGTVPDHWKEGEEIPEGEYGIKYQWQSGISFMWRDCEEFDMQSHAPKRKVIVPLQSDNTETKEETEWSPDKIIISSDWYCKNCGHNGMEVYCPTCNGNHWTKVKPVKELTTEGKEESQEQIDLVPMDFIVWYSGMERTKVKRAYLRWFREKHPDTKLH